GRAVLRERRAALPQRFGAEDPAAEREREALAVRLRLGGGREREREQQRAFLHRAATSIVTGAAAPPAGTSTSPSWKVTWKPVSTRNADEKKLLKSASSSGSTRNTLGPARSPPIVKSPLPFSV